MHLSVDSPRSSSLALGGIALGLLVVHLVTLREGVAWHGDVGQLLLHARNLAAGEPYAATGYVQNPGQYGSPVGYPPGLPLLWAPFVALFGLHPLIWTISATVFLVLAVWALALLYFRQVPILYAGGFMAAAGLQPYLWEAKDYGLSSFALLALAALALLLYERGASEEPDRAPRAGLRWGMLVLAGVLAGYAGATRSLGLVLVPAFLLADVARLRPLRRSSLVAVGAALLTLGLLAVAVDTEAGARIATAETGFAGGYDSLVIEELAEDFDELPARVVQRTLGYVQASWVLWYAPFPGGKVLEVVLALLALVPVGVGFVHRVRTGSGAPEAFVLLYALGLLPWTFSQQRYLIPLLLFYYAYLFIGLHRLGVGSVRRGRAVLATAVLALCVVYVSRFATTEWGPHLTVETGADAFGAYRFIRERTPPDAVFLVRSDPRLLPFFAQRASSIAPLDATDWQSYAERIDAEYAFLPTASERVAPQPPPDLLEPLYANGTWTVYHIVH